MRLEAETIRDRILAASGSFEPRLFGAPYEVKEDRAGQVIVDGEQTRRSIYVRVRRSQPLDMLQAFDAPVMETNCECRSVSTVSTQALMLMNGDFALQHSAKLAERAAWGTGPNDTPAGQIKRAWQLALCRPPTSDELQIAQNFLQEQIAYLSEQTDQLLENVSAEQQAMTNLCQALMSSNEFLYID